MTGITQHPTPEPATYDGGDFCIYHKTHIPAGQTCSFCRVEAENRLYYQKVDCDIRLLTTTAKEIPGREDWRHERESAAVIVALCLFGGLALSCWFLGYWLNLWHWPF